MRIHKAIELYKNGIESAVNNMGEFTMLRCKFSSCNCVRGIKVNGIILDPPFIITKGYRFKLSIDLSNSLEELLLPVIQPERLGQDWTQRNSK